MHRRIPGQPDESPARSVPEAGNPGRNSPDESVCASLARNRHEFGGLIDTWHVNALSTDLTWDLTIAAIALTVWVAAKTVQSRKWHALVSIPAPFGIGVSCGLPLYLFLRCNSNPLPEKTGTRFLQISLNNFGFVADLRTLCVLLYPAQLPHQRKPLDGSFSLPQRPAFC
tara:strand:- start:3482 stop:3991 length:510 start_codon:yes stop_codon:yes gene_type:complete